MSSVTQTKGDLLWNEPECEMRHGKIIGYDYVLQSLDIWAENESDYTTLQKVYFDKLVPYTRYRVRVRAKNSVGHGPFSDWISFQTHPSGNNFTIILDLHTCKLSKFQNFLKFILNFTFLLSTFSNFSAFCTIRSCRRAVIPTCHRNIFHSSCSTAWINQ